jgi:Signal transduction histidine kinase
LGLTISKMLAEVNGGKITVKSKVGLGSVFVLHLPIYRRND